MCNTENKVWLPKRAGGIGGSPRLSLCPEGHEKRTENAKIERKTVRNFYKVLTINTNCGEGGSRTYIENQGVADGGRKIEEKLCYLGTPTIAVKMTG